jgi:hypothetical protein
LGAFVGVGAGYFSDSGHQETSTTVFIGGLGNVTIGLPAL